MSKKNDDAHVTLTLHPAFKDTIPLPMAVLAHAELGLKDGQTLYLIHLLAAQIRGELPINQKRIASYMNVDARTLREYNKDLEALGILERHAQFRNGARQESVYNLDRWLTESLKALPDHRSEIRSLLEELEGIDSPEVKSLLAKYQRLSGSYDPHPSGSYDPHPSGSYDPHPSRGRGADHTIRTIDDDDQYIINQSDQGSSSPPSEFRTPVEALLSLVGADGNRYSRKTASYLVARAMENFGEDAAGVVYGWVAYARVNGRVANPTGFVRHKLETGDMPPEPAETVVEAGNYLDRLPPELRAVIRH